jgi:hypothetical protein
MIEQDIGFNKYTPAMTLEYDLAGPEGCSICAEGNVIYGLEGQISASTIRPRA